MSEPEQTRREAKLSRRIIKNTSDLIVNNLRLMDRDGDGHLSAQEGMAMIDVKIVIAGPSDTSSPTPQPTPAPVPRRPQILPNHEVAPTYTIHADNVVMDRATLSATLSEKFGLSTARVEALVTKAFPKGMEEITAGMVCAANPELQCMPLPNHKVIQFLTPARTT